MTGPYRILGGPGSPYSHKVRAVFRYRRIAHIWIVPQGGFTGSGGLGAGTEIERAGREHIPVVQYPDGEYHGDSTPLIYDLERRHAGRSVIPPDPAQAFLAHLIEDIADEWFPLPMYYLRWTDDKRFCGLRQMVGWMGAVDDAELEQHAASFTKRQVDAMDEGGLTQLPRELMIEQYRRFLDIFEAYLKHALFLFGTRPSIAEFGLYGQLTQYAVDPTTCNMMKEQAVRVFQWIPLMDDASGVEGEWNTPAVPFADAVVDLIRLGADVYLPLMLMCAAHPDTERKQYKAKCLLWLKQELAELPPDAADRVRPVLQDTGMWDALQFAEGEAASVPPMETD